MKNLWILLVVGVTLFSSCKNTKIYFTDTLRMRLESNGVTMKQIQFYTSEEIVLRRELESENIQVVYGKIKEEDGKSVDEIIIKEETPGMCRQITPNALWVSFEAGENNSISFIQHEIDGTVYYHVTAKNWQDGLGEIDYNDRVYFMLNQGNGCKLKVSKAKMNRLNKKSRVASGLRVR